MTAVLGLSQSKKPLNHAGDRFEEEGQGSGWPPFPLLTPISRAKKPLRNPSVERR